MTATRTKAESLGPAFNRLWSASLASNLADGLFKTSALLLAATLTKDPVVISILAAVVMLPWLLFAIPIGGLVDRIDRRLLLATANAIRFAMAAFLAVTVEFNWICHFGPLVRRRFFVETPNLRRRPHIVHLTLFAAREAIYRENFLLYESRRSRIVRFVRQRLTV